jgi:DNA repair protein RadC
MNIQLNKDQKIRIYSSLDIYNVMREILMLEEENDRTKEHFWTIGLDHGQTVLNIELVSLGSGTAAPVEPMEVYSIPLQKKAAKLILVHNHPSGNTLPSPNDEDLTDRLIQVGLILRVPVIDHLIITESSYYSFADSGLLASLAKSEKYVPQYILKQRYEKEARDKGEEKGKKARDKEIILNMRAKGLTTDEIVELTGIPKATVSRIKE